MRLAVRYFIVSLTFSIFQTEISAQHNDNTNAEAEDVKAYNESVQTFQELGKIYNTVVHNLLTTQRGIKDIRTKANSLANQTQLAILGSLELINSAAITAGKSSKACLDMQAERKAELINHTNQEISTVLSSLDQFKRIENELNTIHFRLNLRIRKLLKCNENVTVTSDNIVSVTNCYRQVTRNFSDYIVSENHTINEWYGLIRYTAMQIDLPQKFHNIFLNLFVNAVENSTEIIDCESLKRKMFVERYKVTAAVEKLIEGNQHVIKTKSNQIFNLISEMNLKNKTIRTEDVDTALDGYFSPMVSLFHSTLNFFSSYTGDLSRDKLLFTDVKAEILKNLTGAITHIVGGNATGSITEEVSNIIKNMNERVTEKYVVEKCSHYKRSDSIDICRESVIEDLSDEIKNAHKSLDNLYNQVVELNASFSTFITTTLKTSLIDVYNSTIIQTVNAFTQRLWSALSAANIEVANIYINGILKIRSFEEEAHGVVRNIVNKKITHSVKFVQSLNLWINYERFNSNLETFREKMHRTVKSIFNIEIDIGRNINTIDPSKIDSELKNCTSQQNDFEQAVSKCIRPIITDFNQELNVKFSNLNNILEYVRYITSIDDHKIYLDELKKDLISRSYEIIKNDTKDGTFLAVVELYLKYFSYENDKLSEDAINRFETALNFKRNLFNADSYIDKAVGSLQWAVEFFRMTPQYPIFAQEKSILKILETNAYTFISDISNNVINQHGNISDIKRQFNNLILEYNRNKEEISSGQINSRCKNQSDNDKLFLSCVEHILKNYNNIARNITQRFEDLYKTVINLKSSVVPIIIPKVIEALKPFKTTSDKVSDEIFRNKKINSSQILQYALSEGLSQNDLFLRDIRLIQLGLRTIANKIHNLTLNITNYYTDNLFKSGRAVYDTAEIGKYLCDTKSVDHLFNETAQIISTKTTAVLAQLPDLSPVINGIVDVANFLNSHLNYQLSLLDENRLNALCPSSLAGRGNTKDLFDCFKLHIDKFDSYYVYQSNVMYSFERSASRDTDRSVQVLKKWGDDFVEPQIKLIKKNADIDSERFYERCNITVDQIINFSINTARSYSSIVASNVTAINDLADVIAEKIKPSAINSRLQSVLSATQAGFIDLMKSINKTINNTEIQIILETLFNNAVSEYNRSVSVYQNVSSNYKLQVVEILRSHNWSHESYNYTLVNNKCNNEINNKSTVGVSACTKDLVYSYKDANSLVLNRILSIKQTLQDVVKSINDYTERHVNVQKMLAYNKFGDSYPFQYDWETFKKYFNKYYKA